MSRFNSKLGFLLFLVVVIATDFAHGETGQCSWYTAHAGAKTANGETFNPNGLTAAHKTLPFNSHVKVQVGSRSVVVRINDRGPFVAGRILDVSPAAADHLGIKSAGVVHCTVNRV